MLRASLLSKINLKEYLGFSEKPQFSPIDVISINDIIYDLLR